MRLFKNRADEYPMIVVDIVWKEVPANERKTVLNSLQYPILDEEGSPFVADNPLCLAHLEGTLVGDILAEEVTLQPN
jgi:hypothetical protein